MVYAATLSESQRVMHWQLIIEGFGPNIQYISGVDNIYQILMIREYVYFIAKDYSSELLKAFHY